MVESRKASRHRVLKAGTIEFGGGAIDCLVRNLSTAGAALEVSNQIGIPERFVLAVPGDGLRLPCHIAWRKERRITVVGSKKMVEFDDAHPTEKLRIYDKGYDRPPEFTQYGEYLTVRQGDIHIPRVDASEPLELECKEFVSAIRSGKPPRTDGRSGLRVVEVLEAADRSLKSGGAPVSLIP